jgi:hypothetical protein
LCLAGFEEAAEDEGDDVDQFALADIGAGPKLTTNASKLR